jgi:ferredoxin
MIEASACSGCGSCEFECPNGAISMRGDVYAINPKKCTECKGKFSAPQCLSACPGDAITRV